MINNFNTICQFRQDHPPKRGDGIKTNDPVVVPVKAALKGLKEELEARFQGYRGFQFHFQESKGASRFPYVTHVSILPEGQKVSNGVYVVLCFDKFGRGALVGCSESKTNPKGIGVVIRKEKGSRKKLSIDVDGSNENTKYNNTFANPREFHFPLNDDTPLISHLTASLDRALVILGMLSENEVLANVDAIEEPEYVPKGEEDARNKTMRSIVARRGQRKFRESLIAQYRCCVITGCKTIEVLEAAHIVPYNGEDTNHIQNGLLLRSDIHTLFDLGLISINPETMTVVVSSQLTGSKYAAFDGKKLDHLIASKECLRKHFEGFSL